MNRLKWKKQIFIGIGLTLLAAGIVLAPLPGPGGVPILAAGTYVLIRNSMGARRVYVRARRRWPAVIGPLDRLIRRRRKAA
jgi:Putative transmembrane protein (PGPGW)